MVTLDEDFADGDILYAGDPGDTGTMNGITRQINVNTNTTLPSKLKFGGADTEGTVTSGGETTIATFTIPANTFSTGCICIAPISVISATANDWGDFKLKIGPSGSEVLKQTQRMTVPNNGATASGCLGFYDTAETYSNELVVIVTGTINGSSQLTCKHLLVFGF